MCGYRPHMEFGGSRSVLVIWEQVTGQRLAEKWRSEFFQRSEIHFLGAKTWDLLLETATTVYESSGELKLSEWVAEIRRVDQSYWAAMAREDAERQRQREAAAKLWEQGAEQRRKEAEQREREDEQRRKEAEERRQEAARQAALQESDLRERRKAFAESRRREAEIEKEAAEERRISGERIVREIQAKLEASPKRCFGCDRVIDPDTAYCRWCR